MLAFMWGITVGALFALAAGFGSSQKEDETGWSTGVSVVLIIFLVLSIGFSMYAGSQGGNWQIVLPTPTPGTGR